jgi:hypothetical protein
MKKFRREDGFSELALFQSASDHLASASVLFERGPRYYDSAGYLSHLAIELLIKALILNKCNEFTGGHSLINLKKEFESYHHGSLIFRGDHENTIKFLEGFKHLRYPKILAPIEIGSDDWGKIEKLAHFIFSLFPDCIQDQFKKRDYSEKGNRKLMCRKLTT